MLGTTSQYSKTTSPPSRATALQESRFQENAIGALPAAASDIVDSAPPFIGLDPTE
jgi:hypothetical protein